MNVKKDKDSITVEIFYDDLTESAKKAFDEAIGEDHNYDVFPLAMQDFSILLHERENNE